MVLGECAPLWEAIALVMDHADKLRMWLIARVCGCSG